MSEARLVITALLTEQLTAAEVARYGVHRSWAYRLKARYDIDGAARSSPRSRRTTSSPTATPRRPCIWSCYYAET